MRIIQLLTTVAFGDAVSNDTIALYHTLVGEGFESGIYAENIDSRLPEGLVLHYSKMPELKKQDVIIYHLSTGSDLNEKVKEYKCRKIMIYHNITPPKFFAGYSEVAYQLCNRGLEQAKSLKDTFEYVLADSEFNKNDLKRMGYTCPIDVLPILIKFEDYEKKPNKLLLKKYDDGVKNIVFVGRVAPNKKQEDLIETFHYYNKYYNPNSRLFLVGSNGGMELYYAKLQEYAKQLGEKNIIFPGHTKFEDILAYYRMADLFLCLSEHEGFCVPLVEAMFFDVPIIAYDSCAIKDTLSGSGFLLQEKNKMEIAGAIDYVLNNDELRKTIVQNQREALMQYDNEKVKEQFLTYLRSYLNQ